MVEQKMMQGKAVAMIKELQRLNAWSESHHEW